MTRLRVLLCLTAALGAAAFAGQAQARDSYDCADFQHAFPEGSWSVSDEQKKQFYADLEAAFPNWNDFMTRTCGVVEGGKQMILVGALHVVDERAMCEDDANFGVLYDPQTRKFGDVAPHQKLCWHGDKIPRPQL
jgi:hypothetical protein